LSAKRRVYISETGPGATYWLKTDHSVRVKGYIVREQSTVAVTSADDLAHSGDFIVVGEVGDSSVVNGEVFKRVYELVPEMRLLRQVFGIDDSSRFLAPYRTLFIFADWRNHYESI
jgi:hypothetical protein